jgi:hypothetical protein
MLLYASAGTFLSFMLVHNAPKWLISRKTADRLSELALNATMVLLVVAFAVWLCQNTTASGIVDGLFGAIVVGGYYAVLVAFSK